VVRTLLVLACLWSVSTCAYAQHHEHGGHEHGSNPLDCDSAAGEACYEAVIDDFHSVPSTTDAIGHAFLALNSARTEVRYQIVLDDLLALKPDPADRTEFDDVIGIHFHRHVPDTVGPHILNIFGLATWGVPAEEDADLVVDYENHMLSGIFDISDATIDPSTGQPFLEFFPLTSKVIGDWLDELDLGLWMVAVHTNESGFPNMAIHGHISNTIPEPAAGWLALIAGASLGMSQTSRRGLRRVES